MFRPRGPWRREAVAPASRRRAGRSGRPVVSGTTATSELPRARGQLSARVDRVSAYHPMHQSTHAGEFPRLKRKNLNSPLCACAFGAPTSRDGGSARAQARAPAGSGLVQSDWRNREVSEVIQINPQDDRVPQRVQPVYGAPAPRPSRGVSAAAQLGLVEVKLAGRGRRRPVLGKMTFDPSSPPPPLVLGSTPRASLQHHGNCWWRVKRGEGS